MVGFLAPDGFGDPDETYGRERDGVCEMCDGKTSAKDIIGLAVDFCCALFFPVLSVASLDVSQKRNTIPKNA